MNDENPQASVEAAWSKVTQGVERIDRFPQQAEIGRAHV